MKFVLEIFGIALFIRLWKLFNILPKKLFTQYQFTETNANAHKQQWPTTQKVRLQWANQFSHLHPEVTWFCVMYTVQSQNIDLILTSFFEDDYIVYYLLFTSLPRAYYVTDYEWKGLIHISRSLRHKSLIK